ncbi:hypothetical protein A3C23_00230 [Candidatus Roizmanbacteria bacterium RIFCSPHIGHO2_02_FULL_37_13b]|uniref:HTH luxR-type domain-containing protein n=1 Tax=Candidatus Roizmanbacteria bacterium RIFCSPLOWO2_02_FULL_36_11 TaxID=1802071 RepID=A0A1F7JHP6_9BACT|nr:MAG: hypothetical protein A3C23_00230 [Candidatus Roizmanbacteria bacterium RIFCSPHIGHO2_02_FULL_37_13b]OGK55126.1 MAG: hypothetical protein A3H78_04040 [Candidatus Roizmanbacteria bacterium RIFCSPLOWO2_02_FULL_36_11]
MNKKISDGEIIRDIQQGQIDHYSYLVHRYIGKLNLYVKQFIKKAEDRDDIIQTTFINYYKVIDCIDSSRPIWPYLMTIAKHEVNHFLRQQYKKVALTDDISDEMGEYNIEEKDVIEQTIAKLNEKDKRVIRLLYQGYTYKEIAEVLQKPLNTIKTLIRRLRIKLIRKNDKT